LARIGHGRRRSKAHEPNWGTGIIAMYFKQVLNERCGCASYVIASRRTHEAAIVDPAIETEPYENLLRDRGFGLQYVIDTHIHADHVSGARLLVARHGGQLCLHESAQVAYPFLPLSDHQELELGPLRLRVLHTPGHRPELISILIVNPSRSPEPSMVLTGDSLLVGDVGRPDFGGGDAAAQYDSLTNLLRLPDWVAVFPGHFEGPCGKGMCGRPSTTIGFERLYNPLARLDRREFITRVGRGVPPRPLNMTAIEATNRGRADMAWAMLTSSPEVREVSPDEVRGRPPKAAVVDVREPEEFAGGHVPGAVNLPQADLATRLDEVPRDRPVFVICQGGVRSLRAAQFLRQRGYADVASVKGGTEAWRATGGEIIRESDQAPRPSIVESEWTHAGGDSYSI
jgi:glyoxylase-like metal-dependent hydrolase (beta-lactamase superfamily II)/rhodanese-related sulfurtransferase